eukprot:1156904-Pelagomonas_calceolata.AAC.5
MVSLPPSLLPISAKARLNQRVLPRCKLMHKLCLPFSLLPLASFTCNLTADKIADFHASHGWRIAEVKPQFSLLFPWPSKASEKQQGANPPSSAGWTGMTPKSHLH